MAPDGGLAEETYRVIKTAVTETGTAGIGSIVLSSCERRVLLSPKGKGIAMTTLRTGREVRSAKDYFEGVSDAPVEGELLDMAKMLVERSRKPFQPAELVDRYEEAVRNLVRPKPGAMSRSMHLSLSRLRLWICGGPKAKPGAGGRAIQEAGGERKGARQRPLPPRQRQNRARRRKV